MALINSRDPTVVRPQVIADRQPVDAGGGTQQGEGLRASGQRADHFELVDGDTFQGAAGTPEVRCERGPARYVTDLQGTRLERITQGQRVIDKARPRLDGRGRLTARRRIALGLGHHLPAPPCPIRPKRGIMPRDDAR